MIKYQDKLITFIIAHFFMRPERGSVGNLLMITVMD